MIIRVAFLISLILSVTPFLRAKCIGSVNNEGLLVSAIKITGNTLTHDRIIFRELTFKVGDTLSKEDIELIAKESKENLDNTLLFNFVTIEPQINGKFVEWNVDVVERWYIWPFPIFEYEDRNLSAFLKNGNLKRVNYGTYIKVDNFRGMREQIKIRAVLGYRKQISLQYLTQNLDREKKHGLSVWVSYFTNHEVNHATVGNKPHYFIADNGPARGVWFGYFSYQYRPKYYWYHTFTLGSVHASINDSLASLSPNYFGNGKTSFWYTTARYEAILDKRDLRIFPLSGYLIKTEMGRIGFFENEPIGLWYLKATAGVYSKIAPRFYGGMDIMVKSSTQTNLPYFMNEAVGYKDYVRGYEHYVTNGSNFFINKNSLKFELLPTKVFNLPFIREGKFKKAHLALYWSLFGDLGYVKPDRLTPPNSLEGNLFVGYGTGLYAVAYYDIVLRIEYSFNKFGERGIFFHVGTPFLNR
ncbi:MAG: POTRA domain-containing protein [Tenuifilaceae bacterium]|nr:POTRA domain-containing protein [Tenuifilaceae bacterium]